MAKTKRTPTASIVICTYNGAQTIARAVESIRAQTYPADQYEIIVVNDGSTDDTAAVLHKLDVKTIAHNVNQGIAAARNTGLAAAQGKIYVGFDDDCIAEPTWLSQLLSGYELPQEVLGVGGSICPPRQLSGLADRYMAATGSGNPPSIKLDANQSLIRRFIAYFTDQLSTVNPSGQTAVPVRHINGASSSFPVTLLHAVGGWDVQMSGIEDTDICHRISLLKRSGHFYAIPGAVIIHDPKLSLRQLIKRQLNRAAINLTYYRRNGLIPPIFPFPILWVALSLAATFISPLHGLGVAITLPLALYPWWPLRAIREHTPIHLALGYVQLLEELASLLGMALSWNKVGKKP